jgi:hypothetical protein
MDRESLQGLRLDRRLIGRRNWIDPEELERELEELPDVSDKVNPSEEVADASGEPTAE